MVKTLLLIRAHCETVLSLVPNELFFIIWEMTDFVPWTFVQKQRHTHGPSRGNLRCATM